MDVGIQSDSIEALHVMSCHGNAMVMPSKMEDKMYGELPPKMATVRCIVPNFEKFASGTLNLTTSHTHFYETPPTNHTPILTTPTKF